LEDPARLRGLENNPVEILRDRDFPIQPMVVEGPLQEVPFEAPVPAEEAFETEAEVEVDVGLAHKNLENQTHIDSHPSPRIQDVLAPRASSCCAIQKKVHHWRQLVRSNYVLKAVGEGYKVSFRRRPLLSRTPIEFPPPKDQKKFNILEEEVKGMLEKGVIFKVSKISPGFYSRIFVVKKKTGGFRPVIDLSPLNKMINTPRFKMETAKSVRLSIRKNDFATTIDLKDAYFHIPMHKGMWKYLRFVWQGTVYQFRALPFGLSPAPYIFTRITKPLAAIARERGIRVKMYLDDWLNLNQVKHGCTENTRNLILLSQKLGFNIKPEKSHLSPTTTFSYLGMTFDTVDYTVRPNKDRIDSLTSLLEKLKQSSHASLRKLLSLLGKMESMALLLPLARVHKRPLQREVSNRTNGSSNMDLLVPLGEWFKKATSQWGNKQWLMSSVPIQNLSDRVYLHTDASLEGWGGHTDNVNVQGLWSPEDSKKHINLLELEAVFLCLKKMSHLFHRRVVIICGDNSTCLSYLKNQGGTKSIILSLKAEQILLWAQARQITIETKFVPGKLNVLADQLSRSHQLLHTEWTIAHQALEPLWQLWGKPMIDLFATKYTKRLSLYVSPIRDPEAWSTDAFQMSWSGLDAYAYPPTALIQQVLAKVVLEKPRLILVTPFWPSAAWFPDLKALAKEGPMHLNLRKGLLLQPRSGVPHNNPQFLNLTAWRL
jgi:hypothetical protein